MVEPADYSLPLDASTLVVEVASSAFSFMNKIKANQIKLLWEKLCEFIANTLRQQKGVLLPNLGNFRVGPVIGEPRKKIRPSFTLLEGRYGGVSQERSRYIIGGKTPVIQPNYGQLSTQSTIHRGATQRLVAELLQRLGVHILSGRPIRCEFPGVGKLLTNRVGRLEFLFDPLLLEFFEREHLALVKEMELQPEDQQVLKALQHVNLANPPYLKSPAISRPVSAAYGVTKRDKVATAQHAPYKGELLELYKLCKVADRTSAGSVPRLVLEGFLQKEVRSLLSQVDAATMLDLLSSHAIGKSSKLVLYKPLLDALDRIMAMPGRQDASPVSQFDQEEYHSRGEQQRLQQQQESDGDEEDIQESNWQGPGQDGLPQQQQQPPSQQQQLYQAPSYGVGAGQDMSGVGVGQGGRPGLIQGIPPPTPAEPQDYLHYAQRQLSPRSRADYDNFNRMHFQRLQQARGPGAKRAVTPKVGEEPLNLQEYQAIRQATPQHGMWTPSQMQPSQSPQLPQQQQQQHRPTSPAPQQVQQWAAPRVPQGYAAATPNHMSSPLAGMSSPQGPPRSYQHTPQVLQILRDPQPADRPHSSAGGLGAVQKSQISMYDIINADGSERGKLKSALAQDLQQGWQRQIHERQEYEQAVSQANGQWPYTPVGNPHDKRPVTAVSRPPVSPRRPYAQGLL